MKRIISFAWVALCLAASSCSRTNSIVEYPIMDACNSTHALAIERVELTDSSTRITARSFNHPGWWARWVSQTYLIADGNKYEITGAEGIPLDKEFYMPADGDTAYTLIFKPLPKGTKKFDLIEGDVQGRFYCAGISLENKKITKFNSGFPKALRKDVTARSLPTPTLTSGETTINVHLLGYRPGLYSEVMMFVNPMMGGQEEFIVRDIDDNGDFTVKFHTDGIAQVFMTCSNYHNIGSDFIVVGGETIDVYADLSICNWRMVRKDPDAQLPPSSEKVFFRTTGVFADYNNAPESKKNYRISLYDGEFADYKMSGQEYVDMVKEIYQNTKAEIEAEDMAPISKEIALLNLKNQIMFALGEAEFLMTHNYRSVHNAWDRESIIDYDIDAPTKEEITPVVSLLDLPDPNLWYVLNSANAGWSLCAEIAGIKDAPLGGLVEARTLYEGAKAGNLSEEQLASLDTELNHPIYKEAIMNTYNAAKAALETGSEKVCKTPDVPVEQLFKAIIAPHKGKVVLVDFWNTWCGPCRNAIRHNEPYKSGELAGKDIVWIYIANETSPIGKYMDMIPDIEGLHYRLNEEQWKQLTSKDFDIDGIPSYVLVKKDGSYSLRNDFRNHDLMLTTLLSL